jgi:hypothetical protein
MNPVVASIPALMVDTMDSVDLTFTFDPAQPFEVSLTLSAECICGLCEMPELPPVEFLVARDLIDLALVRPGHIAGQGDVTFDVLDDIVDGRSAMRVGLMGITRHYFVLSASAVRDFMLRTYMVVPATAAKVEIDDAEIATLLKGAAS